MGAIITTAIGYLIKSLVNPSNAGNPNESEDLAIGNIGQIIIDLANGLDFLFTQVSGAWKYVQDTCHQIGHDFEQIEGATENRFDYLTGTFIPHSLAWLNGYIYSHKIAPLEGRMADAERAITDLQAAMIDVQNWRRTYVTPNIQLLLKFRADFYAGDQPSIDVLIDWLRHPDHFGVWAAPPLIGPTIAYYADDAHKRSRDNLTDVIGGAWAETPSAVWSDFEAMLVTD